MELHTAKDKYHRWSDLRDAVGILQFRDVKSFDKWHTKNEFPLFSGEADRNQSA